MSGHTRGRAQELSVVTTTNIPKIVETTVAELVIEINTVETEPIAEAAAIDTVPLIETYPPTSPPSQ